MHRSIGRIGKEYSQKLTAFYVTSTFIAIISDVAAGGVGGNKGESLDTRPSCVRRGHRSAQRASRGCCRRGGRELARTGAKRFRFLRNRDFERGLCEGMGLC